MTRPVFRKRPVSLAFRLDAGRGAALAARRPIR
jgi:hypothetical protein